MVIMPCTLPYPTHGTMAKVGAHAGSETTGYSIAWTLYLLAKHPEVMAKLEAELDAAGLLVTPARPRPCPLAFADISKLRYMDCVLKARLLTARPRLAPTCRAIACDRWGVLASMLCTEDNRGVEGCFVLCVEVTRSICAVADSSCGKRGYMAE